MESWEGRQGKSISIDPVRAIRLSIVYIRVSLMKLPVRMGNVKIHKVFETHFTRERVDLTMYCINRRK